MPDPTFVLIFRNRETARAQAQLFIDDGYDVIVTGPADDVVVTAIASSGMGTDFTAIENGPKWVIFAFNRSPADTVVID